ncbi:hypothetical protein [Haloferula rosea]|uniref:Lipoprotein n=1 Tax=Haloferula rosea TaxID=490093 RepID=A0A934R8N1_9BACT|nr:hypothetical protein [Haloferula rosea]MBK1825940.1 hypothetical protein [Haloferula rosea]
MSALRNYWVILAFGFVASSCDEAPSGGTEPVIPDPLEQVGKILGGEATEPKPDPEPEVSENGKPVIPTAQPVPDKPGFVISPYNGKWIDVTGIAVGEAVADPDFPAEEKKYFRVPAPLPKKGVPLETEAPASDGNTETNESSEAVE